jgi:hypothetical protein
MDGSKQHLTWLACVRPALLWCLECFSCLRRRADGQCGGRVARTQQNECTSAIIPTAHKPHATNSTRPRAPEKMGEYDSGGVEVMNVSQ